MGWVFDNFQHFSPGLDGFTQEPSKPYARGLARYCCNEYYPWYNPSRPTSHGAKPPYSWNANHPPRLYTMDATFKITPPPLLFICSIAPAMAVYTPLTLTFEIPSKSSSKCYRAADMWSTGAVYHIKTIRCHNARSTSFTWASDTLQNAISLLPFDDLAQFLLHWRANSRILTFVPCAATFLQSPYLCHCRLLWCHNFPMEIKHDAK
jgi:hypothetical protein